MLTPYAEIAEAARKQAAHKRAFVAARPHYGAGILELTLRAARQLEWLACDAMAAADGCEASVRSVEEYLADDTFNLIGAAKVAA